MSTKRGAFSDKGRGTASPPKGKRQVDPDATHKRDGGYSAPLARGGVTGFSGGAVTRSVRSPGVRRYDSR